MKNNDTTFTNVGNSSSVMRPVWSYSNGCNYIPNIKENFNFAIHLAYFTKNKITISTEEKRTTKKGGN